MRSDSTQWTSFGLAPVARVTKRRIARRMTRISHAMLGFLGLWAAACGSDQKRGEQSEVAVVMKNLSLRQPLPTHSSTPVTHVIVLGDSISEGLGAEGKPLSYAELLYRNHDDRYPDAQGMDLASLFGDELNYINVAHAGDTTYDVIAHQLPRLRALLVEQAQQGVPGVVLADNPHGFRIEGRVLVVMTVGGNDVQAQLAPNRRFSAAAFSPSLLNLRGIFDFFREEDAFAGGISPYFGNVYDVTDGTDQLHACMRGLAFPGMSQALEELSKSYATLAEQQNATLVDALSLFRGHGFNFSDPSNPYFDPSDTTLWVYDHDCIHPNNRGHDMLRRAFFDRIVDEFSWGGGQRRGRAAAAHGALAN